MSNASELAKRAEHTPRRTSSVRQYRDYGSISIEFGVASECQPESESEQQRIWLGLVKQIEDMHNEWASRDLPNVQAPSERPPERPAQTQPQPKPLPVEPFEYEAAEIYWDQSSGGYKLRTVGHTSPYRKFGATIIPELALSLDLATKIGKDNKFLPPNTPVSIHNGKVVSIGEIP